MVSLSEESEDPDRLKQLRSIIPSDLVKEFEENPAAIARLLSSWTYVNQAKFDEESNIHEFLRGDRPNWALIGKRQYFERDIEEQVYDELLDYATSTPKKTRLTVILGSAGYGITTLLMTLATKLVEEKAGPVLMLKPGFNILEGDIEYACSIFSEGVFFFVDNAADYSILLRTIIHRLRETKRPAMFVLGERINEWKQRRDRLTGNEFEIEPLSDPEIHRLIDCLRENSELNKLEHLNRELQFSAIKKGYKKELLVALKEATEGKGFDAIIEDEFRGIGNQLQKHENTGKSRVERDRSK